MGPGQLDAAHLVELREQLAAVGVQEVVHPLRALIALQARGARQLHAEGGAVLALLVLVEDALQGGLAVGAAGKLLLGQRQRVLLRQLRGLRAQPRGNSREAAGDALHLARAVEVADDLLAEHPDALVPALQAHVRHAQCVVLDGQGRQGLGGVLAGHEATGALLLKEVHRLLDGRLGVGAGEGQRAGARRGHAARIEHHRGLGRGGGAEAGARVEAGGGLAGLGRQRLRAGGLGEEGSGGQRGLLGLRRDLHGCGSWEEPTGGGGRRVQSHRARAVPGASPSRRGSMLVTRVTTSGGFPR